MSDEQQSNPGADELSPFGEQDLQTMPSKSKKSKKPAAKVKAKSSKPAKAAKVSKPAKASKSNGKAVNGSPMTLKDLRNYSGNRKTQLALRVSDREYQDVLHRVKDDGFATLAAWMRHKLDIDKRIA